MVDLPIWRSPSTPRELVTVTLASPSRTSGRVIPPSVYPVVPRPRARLGLHPPSVAEEPVDSEELGDEFEELLDESPIEETAKPGWWRRRRRAEDRAVIN
ncbi:hypothetical protein [Pseudonocardia spinosispora]|uniref:hypothetical protein n=1 Tax=Pseudonocardia spinosispora TaxID=103441 RepID=UPI00048EE8DC|nr:hypothetical protein [Pseudonocardia spinosispora]